MQDLAQGILMIVVRKAAETFTQGTGQPTLEVNWVAWIVVYSIADAHCLYGCFVLISAYALQGACLYCDSVIRGTPVRVELQDSSTKDFCSTYCLNKHTKKEQASQLSEQKRGNWV